MENKTVRPSFNVTLRDLLNTYLTRIDIDSYGNEKVIFCNAYFLCQEDLGRHQNISEYSYDDILDFTINEFITYLKLSSYSFNLSRFFTNIAIYHHKQRWDEAERYILSDIDTAIRYSSAFGRFRWPDLEDIIIKNGDPKFVLKYSNYILGERWKEAEYIILNKDSGYIFEYVQRVVKGPCPEAIKYLSRSEIDLYYDMITEPDLMSRRR